MGAVTGYPRRKRPPPISRLRRLISYNPETGVFTRLIAPGTRRDLIGTEAGCIGPAGYRVMHVAGVLCRAGRVAWAYMTGEWPPDDMEIDHRNQLRADDRWANLRLATASQQSCNMRTREPLSGVRGVRLHKGLWEARIKHEGVEHFLGCFTTLSEAAAARAAATARFHGQFAYKEDEDGRTSRS